MPFRITIDFDKCQSDEECVQACPAQVFDYENGKPVVAREEDCLGCQTCVEVCPVGAITVEEI